jgi:hypothetical protein
MLNWVCELKVDDRLVVIDRAFAKLAQTDEGMIVLVTILDDLCFFDSCKDDKERAWNEYAKILLKRCGRNLAAEVVASWANVFGKELTDGK